MMLLAGLALMACDADGQGTPRQSQPHKAAAAAVSVRFTENAEIDNIKKRLELTSNPGRTGFVLLMNEAGQPIMYTGVKGKITWGGARLTKPTKVTTGREMGTGANNVADQQPSDEGRGETPENTSTS